MKIILEQSHSASVAYPLVLKPKDPRTHRQTAMVSVRLLAEDAIASMISTNSDGRRHVCP